MFDPVGIAYLQTHHDTWNSHLVISAQTLITTSTNSLLHTVQGH